MFSTICFILLGWFALSLLFTAGWVSLCEIGRRRSGKHDFYKIMNSIRDGSNVQFSYFEEVNIAKTRDRNA